MRLTARSSPWYPSNRTYVVLLLLVFLALPTYASRGDRLPEFRECLQRCTDKNCIYEPISPPLHLRLLLWDCPSECDYACQRSVTAQRIRHDQSIEQFHGKWPFRRLFGIQEPFSVLFSILNGYAHLTGLRSLRRELPRNYALAPYYHFFAYFGLFCWFWSAVFHTRDFVFTERMDYFGAGANVLYGLFYTPIRLFRLYKPQKRKILTIWSFLCLTAYLAHVYYLQFVTWDYTYNMAANVVVGVIQNIMWTYFSITHYTKTQRWWTAWPGLIVGWLVMAMSLELLDFPPLADAIDAHSLWHAATILPTAWWYRFLIHDARQDATLGEEMGEGKSKM